MSTATDRAPLQSPLIRLPTITDRVPLEGLLTADGLFRADEIAVALELIDAALDRPDGDYRVLVADLSGSVAGYVCYGPTPMTEGTWDLYWIATHPAMRGHGVASALVESMEREIHRQAGRLIRVETSHQDDYGSAHRFYVRHEYPEIARLRDFYKPGDDLVVMMKRL